MNSLKNVEYIIIHHTKRNNDFPSFIKFRHKYLRGWEDIGYHYLIGNVRPFTKNGKLYFGRSENLEGAHASGHNKDSLGICLIGNFDKISPNEKQFETLFSFLEQKIKQHNIPLENIIGHNELQNVIKSCPGKLVEMDYIRSTLFERNNF